MPTPDDARAQVAIANRVLAHENVLDAFGHVSMRHPSDPGRYLLARSRSPELIEPADVLEFTLDSQPVVPPTATLYGERVLHGCIYQAWPRSLARALGPHWVVLMRRHGATVAGTTLEEMVFRAVFSCRNAEMQREAQALGGVSPLTPAETRKAGAFNLEPRPIARAWEYWTTRLRKAGEALPAQ